MKLAKSLIAVAALAGMVVGPANAMLIGSQGGFPDVGAAGLSVSYTVTTLVGGELEGTFSATNSSTLMSYGSGPGSSIGFLGSYSLNVVIDIANEIVKTGSLIIDDAANNYDLTADVQSFGFPEGGANPDPNPDQWDFLSSVSSASSPAFNGVTSLYTIFPNLGTTFAGLDQGFTATAQQSNNRTLRQVPVPPTVALMAIGLIGLFSRRVNSKVFSR